MVDLGLSVSLSFTSRFLIVGKTRGVSSSGGSTTCANEIVMETPKQMKRMRRIWPSEQLIGVVMVVVERVVVVELLVADEDDGDHHHYHHGPCS